MTNRTWDVLVMAGALGGCGAADQAPAAPTVATPVTTSAEPRPGAESLARLRALEVFSVGEMTVQQPEEAHNC